MRSIPVSGEGSIELAKTYEAIADFLLLDSYRPSDRQIGALGTIHDWSISRRIGPGASVSPRRPSGLRSSRIAARGEMTRRAVWVRTNAQSDFA